MRLYDTFYKVKKDMRTLMIEYDEMLKRHRDREISLWNDILEREKEERIPNIDNLCFNCAEEGYWSRWCPRKREKERQEREK